jgi:hypothetical protein
MSDKIITTAEILELEVRNPLFSVDMHWSNEPSLIESDLYFLILLCVQNTRPNKKGFYRIKKSLLNKWCGQEKTNVATVRNAFFKLKRNDIKWNFKGQDKTIKLENEEMISSLIVNLIPPSKTGQYFYFDINQKLEPLLKNPKIWAGISLLILCRLAANRAYKHSRSIYCMLAWADYQNNNNGVLEIEDWKVLRDSFGMTEKYEQFKIFNRDVLNKIYKDIDVHTNYKILKKDIVKKREGRNIKGLQIPFQKGDIQHPLWMEANIIDDVLKEFGMKNKYIEENTNNLEIDNNKEKIKTITDNIGYNKKMLERSVKEKGFIFVNERYEYVMSLGENIEDKAKYLNSMLKVEELTPKEEVSEESKEKQRIFEIITIYRNLRNEYKTQDNNINLEDVFNKNGVNLTEIENDIEKFYKNVGRADYKRWKEFI